MYKNYLKAAAILGAFSVLLGAFGAHYLKEKISEYAVNIFETGVRYQFYHVFALLVTGILYKEFPNRFIKWSGISFIAGIILFSGSLYCLTYLKAMVISGYDWIGAVTPVGGLLFILGWFFLFTGCCTKSKSNRYVAMTKD